MRRGSVLLPLAVAAACAQSDLTALLQAVERRYNRPRTIQLLFEQTYRVPRRPPRTESGELWLARPARMRWQYTSPAGKLFLVDGKHVWFYTPSTNTVEKSKLKESDDVRAPLAFLIGRLDFQRDFREFRHRREGEETVIVALPRSDRAPYERVEFRVTPEHRIRVLVVAALDQSVNEFRFSGERLDAAVAGELFQFQLPPGAELVEITEPPDRR